MKNPTKSELYKEILSGSRKDVITELSGRQPALEDWQRTSFLALALAANGQFHRANEELSRLDVKDLPEDWQFVPLEAQLLWESSRIRQVGSDKVEQLANRILKLQGRAAFARLVMANLSLQNKNFQHAEKIIQDIVSDFPEADRWVSYLVQISISNKDLKSARKYVKDLPLGYWRQTYWFWTNAFFPYVWVWMSLTPIVILALMIFFPPMVFVPAVLVNAWAMIRAKQEKDHFSLPRFGYFFVMLCAIAAISWYARL